MEEWRSRRPPDQPLGWAKVKAGGGTWIGASPAGAKVGALAKAELAPIWHATETKWGAVTQDANKWIFIGNSNDVETTLDLGGQEPPPSGLELYGHT